MHNQMNCWQVKLSPTRPSHQAYNQRPVTNNQLNQTASQQVSQANRVNPQINQQISQQINAPNQLSQLNGSPRGSFSSDQSTVNLSAAYLSSDYSFGSSTSSNNSSNSLVTSTMNKPLVNQVPNSQPIVEPQIKNEQQYPIKSSVQLNQTSARVQNLPLCFNSLPTPGIGAKRK